MILKCINLEVESTFIKSVHASIFFSFNKYLLSVNCLLGILQDARGRIGKQKPEIVFVWELMVVGCQTFSK